MTRFLSLLSATTLAAAFTLTAAASPAAASSTTIEVSGDGTVYSREFDGLFDGTVLVPRATESDLFSVRNVSARDVYLRIVLTNVVGSSPLYLSSVELAVTSPDGVAGSALLSDATPCIEISTGIPLRSGESVPLGADVTLADLTGTQGQQETARFSLQIVATEQVSRPGSTMCAAAPPGGPPPPPTTPPGGTPTPPTVPPVSPPAVPTSPPLLGVTGGPAPVIALVVSTIVVGAGTGLLARRRNMRLRGSK